MMTHSSTFKLIEQDVWDWIINYIEVENKFYDYKFAPCPFAKSARLKGLVSVSVYESGSKADFIKKHTSELSGIHIMVFPTYVKWFFHLRWLIDKINNRVISKDYYLQYGLAVKTESKYPGIFNSQPYFIVIINKLSDVLKGHTALLNTTYYKDWTKEHYYNVVTRRQEKVSKWKQE